MTTRLSEADNNDITILYHNGIVSGLRALFSKYLTTPPTIVCKNYRTSLSNSKIVEEIDKMKLDVERGYVNVYPNTLYSKLYDKYVDELNKALKIKQQVEKNNKSGISDYENVILFLETYKKYNDNIAEFIENYYKSNTSNTSDGNINDYITSLTTASKALGIYTSDFNDLKIKNIINNEIERLEIKKQNINQIMYQYGDDTTKTEEELKNLYNDTYKKAVSDVDKNKTLNDVPSAMDSMFGVPTTVKQNGDYYYTNYKEEVEFKDLNTETFEFQYKEALNGTEQKKEAAKQLYDTYSIDYQQTSAAVNNYALGYVDFRDKEQEAEKTIAEDKEKKTNFTQQVNQTSNEVIELNNDINKTNNKELEFIISDIENEHSKQLDESIIFINDTAYSYICDIESQQNEGEEAIIKLASNKLTKIFGGVQYIEQDNYKNLLGDISTIKDKTTVKAEGQYEYNSSDVNRSIKNIENIITVAKQETFEIMDETAYNKLLNEKIDAISTAVSNIQKDSDTLVKEVEAFTSVNKAFITVSSVFSFLNGRLTSLDDERQQRKKELSSLKTEEICAGVAVGIAVVALVAAYVLAAFTLGTSVAVAMAALAAASAWLASVEARKSNVNDQIKRIENEINSINSEKPRIEKDLVLVFKDGEAFKFANDNMFKLQTDSLSESTKNDMFKPYEIIYGDFNMYGEAYTSQWEKLRTLWLEACNRITDLKVKISADDISTLTANLNVFTTELTSAVNGSQTQIQRLKNLIKHAKARIEGLEEENKDLRSRIDDINKKLEANKLEKQRINDELEVYREAYANKMAGHLVTYADLLAVDNEIKALESKLGVYKANRQQAYENYIAAKERKEQLEQKIHDLEEEMLTASDERKKEIEEELISLRRQLEEAQYEEQKYLSQYKEYDKQVKEAEAEIDKLYHKKKVYETEYNMSIEEIQQEILNREQMLEQIDKEDEELLKARYQYEQQIVYNDDEINKMKDLVKKAEEETEQAIEFNKKMMILGGILTGVGYVVCVICLAFVLIKYFTDENKEWNNLLTGLTIGSAVGLLSGVAGSTVLGIYMN